MNGNQVKHYWRLQKSRQSKGLAVRAVSPIPQSRSPRNVQSAALVKAGCCANGCCAVQGTQSRIYEGVAYARLQRKKIQIASGFAANQNTLAGCARIRIHHSPASWRKSIGCSVQTASAHWLQEMAKAIARVESERAKLLANRLRRRSDSLSRAREQKRNTKATRFIWLRKIRSTGCRWLEACAAFTPIRFEVEHAAHFKGHCSTNRAKHNER